MEDSEETSQSLQIDLGPLQSDQQTPSSQDGQGKGDDVIVIDSDDEDDDEENDGEHEVSLVWKSSGVHQLSFCSHSLNSPSALCTWALSSVSSSLYLSAGSVTGLQVFGASNTSACEFSFPVCFNWLSGFPFILVSSGV